MRPHCSHVSRAYRELAPNHKIFFDPSHPYTRALLSAVPAIEERRFKPQNYLLEGEPPSPIEVPLGCSFRTRCPFAMDICRSKDPLLTDRDGQGSAACHLPDTSVFANNGVPLALAAEA